jgi:glycoprotein 6-alpha-L-fucosyltransferase
LLRYKVPIINEYWKIPLYITIFSVRRTDKIPEATYHPLEQYMEKVEEIFDMLELTQKIDKRRIYLASEVPEVFEEARQKYPQYEVISNVEATKLAFDLKSRYAFDSLMGMVSDLHMMAWSDFIVCTLSSNICRIVLESMQTIHPDASHLVRTVDTLYFNYAENEQHVKVIHESRATRKNGLKVGDVLVWTKWNHDGLYGVYRPGRSNETFYIPRMTVEKIDETAEFPLNIPDL